MRMPQTFGGLALLNNAPTTQKKPYRSIGESVPPMKRSKHPSLPYILLTGFMLIGLELHWTWEQSTPRERAALVVATAGEARQAVVVLGYIGRVGALCGLGAGLEGTQRSGEVR
jgi:hypothetical protein